MATDRRCSRSRTLLSNPCVAARVYPQRPDSTGVSLRSQGVASELTRLDVGEMGSIY